MRWCKLTLVIFFLLNLSIKNHMCISNLKVENFRYGLPFSKGEKPPIRFEDMEDWKKDEFHNISSSNLVNLTLYYKEYGLFLFLRERLRVQQSWEQVYFQLEKKQNAKLISPSFIQNFTTICHIFAEINRCYDKKSGL